MGRNSTSKLLKGRSACKRNGAGRMEWLAVCRTSKEPVSFFLFYKKATTTKGLNEIYEGDTFTVFFFKAIILSKID